MATQLMLPTFLPGLEEQVTLAVFDRGVPGKERIRISPRKHLDIGTYCLVLGLRSHRPRIAVPLQDCFLWFGNVFLGPNDHLFVYTGAGEPFVQSTAAGTLYVLFWKRPTTVFTDPNIVPMFIQFGAISVGDSPLDYVIDKPQ